jgi:hypothetical protein
MNQIEQQFFNDLEKKLWTAADKLRSNLDAAVYKHVVLGLIFLKYVSDAFEEWQKELREQRVTHPLSQEIVYEEPICKLVDGAAIPIWNCEWISDKKLKGAIASANIIDREKLAAMEAVISAGDVELFLTRKSEGYYA